jgi:hypothetical protein
MPDQVPAPVAKARAAALRQVAAKKKQTFAKTVAKLPRLHVVVEEGDPPGGRCEYYLECLLAPEPGSAPPRPGARIAVAPAGVKGTTIVTRRLR